MRLPHSFAILLAFLSLLLFVVGDLQVALDDEGHDAATTTYPVPHGGANLSNAQRLARGLPLKQPESHVKLSGGTKRYTAQLVKRSSLPDSPDVFNIALQPVSTGSTVTKRDGGVGWATVVEGQLTYTDSVALAAKFVWAAFLEGEMRALKWIPDDSQGIYQEGMDYAMYAVQNSGVWSTGFGDIPADAVSKFFDQVMDTVFSPSFSIDGDTTAKTTDFIWIIDTSGQIHFAPDVSTAVALYPGCSVAVAQTIVPGGPATVDAALGWKSSSLTSAGQLYVLGSDAVGRWIAAADDGSLELATDSASATTFYFPSLGTSGPQKILFQQYEQTSTVILADETGDSAHLAGMPGSSSPALFTIPTTGKGVVTSSVGASVWNFYTKSDTTTDLSLCSTATSCGATFSPICVELVPNGQTPSACAATLPKGTEKWLYATHVIGPKMGWIGISPDTNELEWAAEDSSISPITFIVPDPADTATQALGVKMNGQVDDVRLLHTSRSEGYPDTLALSTWHSDNWDADTYNVLTSAHVTITPEGFIKTAGGNWFRTFDWLYPLVVCDGGNPWCQYAYEPICIEAVDVGGTPSKCLGQMQSNVAKNARKIYAVTEDNSLEGWLELDNTLFKPLSTRDAASTFYIPGLGNGTTAQELYTGVPGGGYNSWWGPYISQNYEYPWLGYGRFGTDPGTGGNQYNVAFNVSSSGLGLLTPDPNFYDSVFSGMQFYYNPDDTLLYLAGSQTDAKRIGANLVGVCLELVDANDSSPPTACKAAKPVKRWLWAEYTDGSGEGWVGNDPNVGVGGLKWGIPTSPTDTKTFYIPATPSTSGLNQMSINTAASGDAEAVQPIALVDGGMGLQQFSPTTSSTASTSLFNIPESGLGIVTLASGSFFFTAPWEEPIYSCPESGCGESGPYQALCIELVEVGGTPSACAAQAKAKIENNPTLLYAATSDGQVGAYARVGTDGVLKLDGSTSTATGFFVPGLNNGSAAQDTYAAFSTGYGKIWGGGVYDANYNVKGFSNLRAGYDASSTFELPIIYPSNTEYGIVTPGDAFYSYFWQAGSLKYYVNYADLTIHAFPSEALATANLGSNIAQLCLESVASGDTPGKCAASFPKQSGPSYLYATGDGGTDGGYVSVNTNTGKITWTRTSSTTNAATFYAAQLGSTDPQELLVKVGDTNRPLYAPTTILPQIAGSADTTLHPASLFTVPTSGAGVITAPSGLGFYTSTAGFPVYGCSDSKCGSSTVMSSICVEIVPVGSAPGACLAQALAATAKNGMTLYARSSDGSVDGYVQGTATGMTPYAAAADATVFYVPTYGNGSAQHDTYTLLSGSYQKIWTSLFNSPSAQRVVSTNKLVIGRSAASGGYMIPLIYPSGSVYGAVTPYHAYFASQGSLQFYVNKQSTDHSLYAAVSDANAAYIGNEVVKVCVESVPVGGSPSVCNVGARKRGPMRVDQW